MAAGTHNGMLGRRLKAPGVARLSALSGSLHDADWKSAACQRGQTAHGCSCCLSLKCSCACHRRCAPVGVDRVMQRKLVLRAQ
jgi:hypothetical protein